MTHPLAQKAASHVIREYVENVQDFEEIDIANRIHTTAVAPLIEAGDELEKALDEAEVTWLASSVASLNRLRSALANWRKVKGERNKDGEG